MDSELTDEQTELQTAIRTLLERRGSTLASRAAAQSDDGFDRELWSTLSEEIGAAALAIPEEFDGIGATSFESHLVLEALGESLIPSPYLGSVAIAAQAILLSGDSDSASRLLPGIAAGESIAALAWADPTGQWSPAATGVVASEGDDSWTLDGTTPLVLDGAVADPILVIATTPDGPGLFEILDAASVTRIAVPAVDPMLRFATLGFSGSAARLLTRDKEVFDRIRDTALVAITALQCGVAQRGLTMTVEYSKQRFQFGRAIGSFQALKHRMADMHVRVETSRSISRAAARSLAYGDSDVGRLALVAKAWCGDSLDLVAAETVQIHGGIAITWEHDAQLVFKRAHALSQLFGQAGHQRRRLARELGFAPAS